MHHNILITTLSPVSILDNSSKSLSPYADYYIDDSGKHLVYINHSTFEQSLNSSELLNEYINGVKKSDPNNPQRSNFSLKSFIKRIKADTSTFNQIPLKGDWSSDSKVIIQSIVKDAGRPYIPGSSIKGAIRTAILYDWLANTKEGEKEMNKIIAQLDTLKPICIEFNNIDKIKKKDRSIDQQKKYYELAKNRKKGIEQVFDESHLFGSLSDKTKAPLSQFLSCSDSSNLMLENICATYASRIHIKDQSKNSNSIPMPKEAIRENQTMRFELRVGKGNFDNSELEYLSGKTEDILKILTSFSHDFICFELEELNEIKNQSDDLKNLIKFYTALKERIENDEYILRIGSGKTFYDNSLILTLLLVQKDEDSVRYSNAIENMKVVFQKDIQNIYPVTRTISPGGIPFGWIKLTV
jgi:CRISPR-associated protein Csm5